MRSPRPRPARPRAASDALDSAGGPVAVDALLALAADEDPQLRVQAANALPKAVDSDSSVTPQLATRARDDEAAVRAATISGLASTGRRPSHEEQLLLELTETRPR
ncbi:hypothetical protein [Micromonospora sp. NPDC007230]|uniref:hypothetical protein n=1 Tax=Micromonospora sp. NPDC007230 TaxID=3364237 RepID=UPI003674FEEC